MMFHSLLLLATSALPILAVPTPQWWGGNSGYGWGGNGGQNWGQWKCTPERMEVRQDFNKMAPADRKAYTDAVKCLMDQPSQLDPALYPGAINRFFDYATIHINRTSVVHLDGFFLTWHRMFIWLYEQDLKRTCGYQGTQPYWNWPATADDLQSTPIFNGDEYSMSGDGLYTNNDPIVLEPANATTGNPGFSLPHGSGGGCVTTGPFANMNYTMAPIPINVLLEGLPLPTTAYDYNSSCLTRDLNTYVAQTQTNWTEYFAAVAAPDATTFATLLNGNLGGTELGLHSGAHFVMGSPASSIFVSPQDPIWFPLHTMLDNVYVQWQLANPDIADTLSGTETANDIPASANVTLSTMEPDWGYLFPSLPVSDLVSTSAGPFCYRYDWEDGPYTEKR